MDQIFISELGVRDGCPNQLHVNLSPSGNYRKPLTSFASLPSTLGPELPLGVVKTCSISFFSKGRGQRKEPQHES